MEEQRYLELDRLILLSTYGSYFCGGSVDLKILHFVSMKKLLIHVWFVYVYVIPNVYTCSFPNSNLLVNIFYNHKKF